MGPSCHDEWSDALLQQIRLPVIMNDGIEWKWGISKCSVICGSMCGWQFSGQPHIMVSAGHGSSPCHSLLDDR